MILRSVLVAAFLFLAGTNVVAAPITIGNGVLLRGGAPWVPKGVVVTGFVCPGTDCRPVYVYAKSIWGNDEIQAIKNYGADTVNLKASQNALDPQGAHYDAGYAAQIAGAVAQLRQAGLAVIVSMDWGHQTGVTGQEAMANAATVRAWTTLAPKLGHDSNVMLQVFDEPCRYVDTPEVWREWQSGHQAAIDAIRRAGSTSILIVEGIRCGKWLTNVPPLNDPLGRIIYGAHPYPYTRPAGWGPNPADEYTVADYDRTFGAFQRRGHVVIITEWNSGGRGVCHDGSGVDQGQHSERGVPNSGEITASLLHYAQDHRIGLVIWAFDLPSSVFVGKQRQRMTSVVKVDCSHWMPQGSGAMVHDYFTTGRIRIQ